MNFMGMGLQQVGIGLKLMGMGWGRVNSCGDGADVHYRVTLLFCYIALTCTGPRIGQLNGEINQTDGR